MIGTVAEKEEEGRWWGDCVGGEGEFKLGDVQYCRWLRLWKLFHFL